MASLISELNDFGFSDTPTSTKVAALQQAIWDIESRMPWPFLEQSIDLTFDGVTGTPTNMPADFKTSLRVKDLTTGRRLDYVRLDDFEDLVDTNYTTGGDPILYYFESSTLKVWRVPPAGRTVRLKYLRASAAVDENSLDSAILIPARHKQVILYGALVDLYDIDDDPDIAARNETKFEARILHLQKELFERQFDRPDFIHATDPDDWDYGAFH